MPAFTQRHSKLLSWACKPPPGISHGTDPAAGGLGWQCHFSWHPQQPSLEAWKGPQSCKLNWAQQEKACPGSLGNRRGVTASERGDPHPTHELFPRERWDEKKKKKRLLSQPSGVWDRLNQLTLQPKVTVSQMFS